MLHHRKRFPAHMVFLAGLALVASPLVADLVARQGGGGGGQAPLMIHSEDLDPRLRGFRWRSIGPTGQGGRIALASRLGLVTGNH